MPECGSFEIGMQTQQHEASRESIQSVPKKISSFTNDI